MEVKDPKGNLTTASVITDAVKPEIPVKGVQAGTPAPPAPAPTKTDAVVDAWIGEYFYNSPIARHTDSWNLLMRVKEVLKERLRGA